MITPEHFELARSSWGRALALLLPAAASVGLGFIAWVIVVLILLAVLVALLRRV
jgi:hypothetical protein